MHVGSIITPGDPETGGRQGTVVQAALLLLASCLPILGAVLVAPLLPAIAREYAGQPGVEVLVPLVIAAPALLIALISPVAGAIADRWGRRRVLLVGFPLYAILGLAPIFLSSLPLIVASRFALGAAEAMIMTICTALLGDYFRSPVRERVLSLQTIAASLSAIIFVIVGGLLGAQDWRAPFWLYGVAFLFAPVASLLLWEPLRARDTATSEPEAMPWSRLFPLYGLTFMGAVGFYVVPAQAAFLLTNIGVTGAAEAGMVNGAGQFAVLLGAASFNLLRRLGHARMLAVGFAGSAIGLLLLGLAHTLGAILFGAIVTGLGVGILLPGFLAATLEGLSLSQRGRGAGGFTTAFFLGQFASPLIVLLGQGSLGSLGGALVALAGVTALCVPAVLLTRFARSAER